MNKFVNDTRKSIYVTRTITDCTIKISEFEFCNAFIAVCHLLGDYLEGIKKDFEKASKVYKSTCDDYGYAKSCYKYGNYSFLGKGKSGSKGEPRVAYQYYEKGCNLNDSDACLHSGLLLVSRSMPKEIDRNVPKVSVI